MRIKFELTGGSYDGTAIGGDEAEFYFRMTDGGTVGKEFWIAPQCGLQHIGPGGKWDTQPPAQKYRVTTRVEEADGVLVRAGSVEVGGQE